MIGTIRYMSPERLAGAGYGVAADVWSLGVVLLEMAARRLPFENAVSQIELHDRLEASKTDCVLLLCGWSISWMNDCLRPFKLQVTIILPVICLIHLSSIVERQKQYSVLRINYQYS